MRRDSKPMDDPVSAELPYPGITERMVRLEDRHDRTDVAVSSLLATTAVHTEQIADMQGDMKDVVQSFKDASTATNLRIDRLIRAVWAAVVLLLPIAVTLAIFAIQQA